MDRFFAEVKAVNIPASCTKLTGKDIVNLQRLGSELVYSIESLLEISTSTKIHRIASHIEDQIKNFGNITVSNTDVNETMNKGVKEIYKNTNRHMQDLGVQIFNVMACSGSFASLSPSQETLILFIFARL